MKKINKLRIRLIQVLAIVMFASCADYLKVDYLLNDQLDVEGVFSDVDKSKQWLGGVYSWLRRDNWDVCIKEQNANQFNFISDDMYYTDREKADDYVYGQLASYRIYRGGKYTEAFLQWQWAVSFFGIRDASIYIHNADLLLNRNAAGMSAQQLATYVKETKAEARFLRAYFYWQLLRKYGPIPIMPDKGVVFSDSYDELSIPRSTYEQCVDFIASEMALAACDLPLNRGANEVFKPTKGAALTARAKVYLYGASPQYNGNKSAWAAKLVSYDGSRLIDSEYKEVRWAKAAAAAKEVMDLEKYILYTVQKREFDRSDMSKLEYTDLPYSYYLEPKTIEPGGKVVKDGNAWKIVTEQIQGYSDAPFNNGKGECGWADIDPCESYRSLFDGSLLASKNPELIFSRGYGAEMNNLSFHQMPRSLGGWNCHGLTLKMYDAYYMADGTDFYRYKVDTDEKGQKYFKSNPDAMPNPDTHGWLWDENDNLRTGGKAICTGSNSRNYNYYRNWQPLPPGASMQNANREPRFYASVAYNGSIWENTGVSGNNERYKQIFTYRGGAQADNGKNASGFYYWTGIGIRKYYNKADHAGALVDRAEPAMRYAEVLLTYAEALNELTASHTIPSYDGSGDITVSRTKEEISKGLRPVRVRAGLTDFTDEYYGDRDEMRMRIKREWQIEFMGESHRYYDLRRWGDAEREESQPVWGFNMDMTGPDNYSSANIRQRDLWLMPHEISLIPAIFAEKMYLWPISHNELRQNRRLTQNPGWRTFDE